MTADLVHRRPFKGDAQIVEFFHHLETTGRLAEFRKRYAHIRDYIQDRHMELFRRLPSLSSRAEVKMGGDFFAVDFNPLEREILSKVQSVKNLAELIDALPATDLELLTAIESLKERDFLLFHEPEHRIHVVTDSICDLLP